MSANNPNVTVQSARRRIQGGNIGEKIFDISLYIIVGLLVFICLAPFVYIISLSFSSVRAINSREVYLWPVEFDLLNYYKVLNDPMMLSSLWNSIVVTVSHTALAMVMTVLCAYPLTKSRLKGRKVINLMIIFTMLFSGGLIPDYLLIKNLGMTNSLLSLIIPGCLATMNMIILRTFFINSIPQGIEEAAMVDGCNDFVILIRVVLPLSMPVLATLSLFYAVGRWNGFQDAKFYINKQELYTLPQKINAIINSNRLSTQTLLQDGDAMKEQIATSEGLKAASIVFTTLPILIVYPWLQKYFVSGVMIGAIKG